MLCVFCLVSKSLIAAISLEESRSTEIINAQYDPNPDNYSTLRRKMVVRIGNE
jgi:hypothetical protein